jgi:alpha-L-rhamnosidase
VKRIDRRTFLARSLKVGATIATSGVASDLALDSVHSAAASTLNADARAESNGTPGPPHRLTTSGIGTPQGVDPDDVMFGWHVADHRRGAIQSHYQIVVSPTERPSTIFWDSGKIASGRQAFVPYGGPRLAADTRYRWTVRTADGNGGLSAPSAPGTFTTGLRKTDWKALWVRPGPPDPGQEVYTYLRTTTEVAKRTVAYATVYVAAAHKYQLWVNGKRIDTGPSFCFPDEQYYQATDVTKALIPGRRNSIGILHHWYGPGQGRPTSAPGLLVQVMVHYTDGTTTALYSNGSWKSRRAEWLAAPQRNNDGGDFVEWIDGQLSPVGWSEVAYDDKEWTRTEEIGPVGSKPFTELFAQRTRIIETMLPAVSLQRLSTGSVVVDFGKIYAGRPVVRFDHGVAGHSVPLHVGYTLDPDGSVSTTHNTQGTDLSYLYIQRSGEQTFDPYCYLGFRYLQIDDPGEAIGIDQVALASRHSDVPDQPPATFSSSDKTLDAVWTLCAHSALNCSQEQFVDTPTREKGQFVWDSGNESQTMMRVYGEQNLTWQAIRDMARAQARYWPTSGQVNEVYPNDDGPQSYPLFTAFYPEWVWRYYLSSGDDLTVTRLLPTMTRLSDWVVSTFDSSTGLMSGLPMSTNGDNEYGYDYNTNADTTLNILAVNAFRRIGDIATLAGNAQTALIQSQRAIVLSDAINTHLVGPLGLYVDGLRSDGTPSAVASQLANLAALAYGVAPVSEIPTLAKYVASLDISVEPDHGMELLRALHAGGRDADVVRILTDSSFPGWAAILRAGGTFTWETWRPSDLIGDSMSHGWGSSALVAMQEILLGVAPAAPAAGEPATVVTITPPRSGLSRAEGSFPTPAGSFSVAWRSAGGRLSIVVPPNARARCTFPGVTLSQLTEGGTAIDHVRGIVPLVNSSNGVTVALGGGRYNIAVRT